MIIKTTMYIKYDKYIILWTYRANYWEIKEESNDWHSSHESQRDRNEIATKLIS